MKNLMRNIALLLMSVSLILGVINVPAVQAQEDEPLVIGMEAGYPPYNWTQSDDSNDAVPILDSVDFANGYDVQIARRIGEALGREVVVMKLEWEGIIPALQSDKIDLIIAGMSPTEERAEVIDFSDPYYEVQFAIVMMADGPYADATTLDDLEGARITGQLATLHYDLVEQIPGVVVQEAMRSFPIMRVALEADRLDGYISEVPEAVSATQANPALTYIIPEPNFEVGPGDGFLSIGIKKGNPLLEEVNAALAEISEEDRAQFLEDAINNQPANQEEE